MRIETPVRRTCTAGDGSPDGAARTDPRLPLFANPGSSNNNAMLPATGATHHTTRSRNDTHHETHLRITAP